MVTTDVDESVGSRVALSDDDYQAQANFRYAMRRFFRHSEEQARMCKITPQQHMLLLIVRGHPKYPGVSITEIAEHLQIRHHSASLLVERGVRRGLLIRQQDQNDRRRALVSLSPEGTHVLEQITLSNRSELKALENALKPLRDSMRRAERD
jgi:DNA-binding MarR family transcriptional regulator